jgi:hypothetical protein
LGALARAPLTLDQILAAEVALREAMDSVKDIRRRYGEAGQLVQLPKIPSLLSESIVYWLMRGTGEFESLRFREEGRDMIGRKADGRRVLIEVKSTGASAFQHLSKKDLESDILVWVHFRRYFEGRKDRITAYLFKEIGQEIDSPGRTRLSRIKATIPRERQTKLREAGTIRELLPSSAATQRNLKGFLA